MRRKKRRRNKTVPKGEIYLAFCVKMEARKKKNFFPHFFFPQKETWRKEKLAPDEDTVAKTAFLTKIPAALFLLKKLAENFLTLITRLLPTHCAMCGGGMRDASIILCGFYL